MNNDLSRPVFDENCILMRQYSVTTTKNISRPYVFPVPDNAYDPDVSASNLWIDREMVNGHLCLVFRDNGNGMDLDHLDKMLR